ncbi:MAG: metal ABC transporter ATP-binding protein, partial [Bacteroidaceae bacterium]|nr:metal ABC transporter ATP-binding protein [Bacteroidaceae bacterium]
MNKLIQLQDIHAAYEHKVVLRNVNLTVYERDFLGVIGPNGGGKTTLMRVILGLLKPTSGEVRFFQDNEPVPRITLGYLPQYNQIDKKFPISVHEVVISGLYREKPFLRDYTAKQKARVEEVICQMGLEGLENRQIGELSGGQLQRVLLGRAIVQHPLAVILDEPNTYLDMRFEERLYQLLNEINRESAIILVSHDIGT